MAPSNMHGWKIRDANGYKWEVLIGKSPIHGVMNFIAMLPEDKLVPFWVQKC